MAYTVRSFHNSILGIFSKPDDASQERPVLRVAEIKFNMHELLTSMTDQASRVISCIIDMVNAAYTVPLPDRFCHSECGQGMDSQKRMKAVNVPQKLKKRFLCNDEEEEGFKLSSENCANIIDCVIGEVADDILSSSSKKKRRLLPSNIIIE